MDIQKLYKDIEREEGFVATAYKDHLGYTTIGIGRMIDEKRGGGISHEEALYLLRNDVARCITALRNKLEFWDELNEARKAALVHMTFQLGINGFMRFKRMIMRLEQEDYVKASEEALDSKWARSDTPDRARRIASVIRNGE